MPLYAISQVTDLEQIRAFLNTDRDYAAYALGDLEPPYDDHATWVAASRTGEIEGLALLYTSLDPVVLFLMGDRSAISALLMHGVGPREVFYTAKPDMESLLNTFYVLTQCVPMYRMRVTKRTFRVLEMNVRPQTSLLSTSHAQLIQDFIHESVIVDGRSVAFLPDMVDDGYYHGVFQNEKLIAVAGTHLVAHQSGLAAVGNVLVHPDHRGKGLGTLVSEAVTGALLNDGFDTVVLNVSQDNAAAIHIYHRLGFEIAGEFIEGAAVRR